MPQIIVIVCTVLLAQSYVSYGVENAARRQDGLRVILEQPLTVPGPEIVAISIEKTMPPGDPGTPPHFHSGPTVGYVIQGEYLFQVEGGNPRIIPAGEAFYEVDRVVHVWSGNASNSTVCKITATISGRPGEDYITLVKDYKRQSRDEAIVAALQHEEHLTIQSSLKDELKK